LQHQRRLAAAHRTTDTNRESALTEVAIQRKIAFVEMAGVIVVLVSVSMRAVIV
jgi:hypothetical protein